MSLKRKQDKQYNVQMANCKYLSNEVPGMLCTNGNAVETMDCPLHSPNISQTEAHNV